MFTSGCFTCYPSDAESLLFFNLGHHAETLIFDVLNVEWTVAVPPSPSSVIANKVSHVNFFIWSICLGYRLTWIPCFVSRGNWQCLWSNPLGTIEYIQNLQCPWIGDTIKSIDSQTPVWFKCYKSNGPIESDIESK